MPTVLGNLPSWPYFYSGISVFQVHAPFSNPHICLPAFFVIQKRTPVKQVMLWIYIYFYIYIWIYIYYVMDLFEGGCPKFLTLCSLPNHHSLATSMCLFSCSDDNFPRLGAGCLDHSRALVLAQAAALSWQRNLSAREAGLTSELCLPKRYRCNWHRPLGSEKSNPNF